MKIRILFIILILLCFSIILISLYSFYSENIKMIDDLKNEINIFIPYIYNNYYEISDLYSILIKSNKIYLGTHFQITNSITGWNGNIKYKFMSFYIIKKIIFKDQYVFINYLINNKNFYVIYKIKNIFILFPNSISYNFQDIFFIHFSDFFRRSKYNINLLPRINEND